MSNPLRCFLLLTLALLLATACGDSGADGGGNDGHGSAGAPGDGDGDGDGDTSSGGACAFNPPPDGTATLAFESGSDDMSTGVGDGGEVELSASTIGTGGGTLSARFGAATKSIDFEGTDLCINSVSLVFKSGAPAMAGVEQTYGYDGDPTDDLPSVEAPNRFYVDVNEDDSIGGGVTTIEYMGTEGTFTYTDLNAPTDDDDFMQTLQFDVVFTKVTDDALDDSVQTSLAGSVTFETLGEI